MRHSIREATSVDAESRPWLLVHSHLRTGGYDYEFVEYDIPRRPQVGVDERSLVRCFRAAFSLVGRYDRRVFGVHNREALDCGDLLAAHVGETNLRGGICHGHHTAEEWVAGRIAIPRQSLRDRWYVPRRTMGDKVVVQGGPACWLAHSVGRGSAGGSILSELVIGGMMRTGCALFEQSNSIANEGR